MPILRKLLVGSRYSSDESLFEVVGASVAGPSHLTSGTPCQDRYVAEVDEAWAVAVVSDGAGSAKRALDGAEIVSTEVCQQIAVVLRSREKGADFRHGIESCLINSVERARDACLAIAKDGEDLKSFNATLVGVAICEDEGVFFHIGDGGASAHVRTPLDLQTIAFSEPENGEYINQTYFFSGPRWKDHLRLTEIPSKVSGIWLMSDGAYELVVPHGQKGLRDSTEAEVDRLVFGAPPHEQSGVLAAILSSPQAIQRSDDDKTLVIIRRKGQV